MPYVVQLQRRADHLERDIQLRELGLEGLKAQIEDAEAELKHTQDLIDAGDNLPKLHESLKQWKWELTCRRERYETMDASLAREKARLAQLQGRLKLMDEDMDYLEREGRYNREELPSWQAQDVADYLERVKRVKEWQTVTLEREEELGIFDPDEHNNMLESMGSWVFSFGKRASRNNSPHASPRGTPFPL